MSAPSFEEALRLANYILARQGARWTGPDREDLQQVAAIAAWEACQSYDATKARFSTYVCSKVRWALNEEMRVRLDRIGRAARHRSKKVLKETGQLPDWARDPMSLDAPGPECDEGADTWGETMLEAEPFEEAALTRLELARLLASLSPYEARLVWLYVAEERTAREITREIGGSVGWAPIRCKRALAQLRMMARREEREKPRR